MSDGFTFFETLLEDVMPGANLDVDMTTKAMYEDQLSTHFRYFWLFLPALETSVAAAYGAADHQWAEMETPDEPRGLTLRFYLYKTGGGTSVQAKIRIAGDAGTDVEVSTTSTSTTNVAAFFFPKSVWTARKDTQVTVDLFLKATGGGTCNVDDIGQTRCHWEQDA